VEPQYTGFSICLRAAGARLVDVPVDEQGMQGERLAGVAARLACVTPSHQYPTGAVVSLQRRARTRTAARRGTLLDAVGHALGDRARVRGASAGLHVRLELPGVPAHAACALREACRRRGVGVYPAARFYAKPPAHAELLLGYAALDQDAIREGVVRLAEAVDRLDAW
jgi:DNA-binding transcriptional MocR family regulator